MNHKSPPQPTAAGKKAGQAFSKLAASPWLQIMILVFVCAAVYINSLPNGFVFDDYAVIVEVSGAPALTANSLIDAANIYHRIEEDLLL